jgi:hypothetical protein
MEPSVSITMTVLGSSPSPSARPGAPSISWIISVNKRILVFCLGAEYQRSNTAISQSA